MNYVEIKALAKQLKVRITDLLALSRNNDPFYSGMGFIAERAHWFAEQFRHFDFPKGVHLRRIHYVLMSQETPVLMRNGMPYENTLDCWGELIEASKAARYLHLVDPDDFEDRRNPPPIIDVDAAAPGIVEISTENPPLYIALPSKRAFHPALQIARVSHRTRYLLEIWCEKSTMNDVLLPIRKEYHANLVTGLGEMSTTQCHQLVQRVVTSGRPGRVFYLSDFDPAGQSMPVAVARKLEFFARQRGDLDIRLYPIVLTASQIEAYHLPRAPIKESEHRRAAFEARHGEGATELDALEALHPGELGHIVSEHLERYRDPNVSDEVEQLMEELQARLDADSAEIEQKYARPLRAAEKSLQAIATKARKWTQEHLEVWHAIREELEAAAHRIQDSVEPPEEAEAEEFDNPLLDTTREYLDQMRVYKEFQKREVGDWRAQPHEFYANQCTGQPAESEADE